jgi:hypothetical protein
MNFNQLPDQLDYLNTIYRASLSTDDITNFEVNSQTSILDPPIQEVELDSQIMHNNGNENFIDQNEPMLIIDPLNQQLIDENDEE